LVGASLLRPLFQDLPDRLSLTTTASNVHDSNGLWLSGKPIAGDTP
jgi:hypothetical protein